MSGHVDGTPAQSQQTLEGNRNLDPGGLGAEEPREVVLRVDNLTTRYGDTLPVKGVSFTLRKGERVGIVGESGSGKSLTALSIMRLAKGAELGGAVWLGDRKLLEVSERAMTKVRGGRIAMVYQDPMSSLNPVHTIGRQLVEAIRLHENTTKKVAWERGVELLGDVGIPFPENRMEQHPHEFSGGMRQRVMIAMALAAKPEVLIADEPTTALDVTTQARIIDLLDGIAEKHDTAVLLITHDLGVAAGFCETIHVMRNGDFVESAKAEKLYRDPQHAYTASLLGAVVDIDIDVTAPIPSASLGTNLSAGISERYRAPVSAPPGALLKVTSVTKTFSTGGGGTITAVDDVSFGIERGQSYGLVGESGSGKSTLSRAVLALENVDAGSVIFDQLDLHKLSHRELRPHRLRMQMVFQDPLAALNRRHTVHQTVAAPLVAHGLGTKNSRSQQVFEALDMVGLPRKFADRLPHTMSGGQCQRVAIARALVLGPELLVLDEAVSALDVTTQAQVLNLLRELQTELGLTYLFVSHDLAVVRYMCDRIGVMRAGKLVEEGSREELFGNPSHEYTRSLMASVPIADPRAERGRRREAARLVKMLEEAEGLGAGE